MHEMESSNLEGQLLKDAAHEVPPFGAESIKLARDEGPKATPVLMRHIKAGKTTALLALEALREADFESYDSIPPSERVEIYARALKNSNYYNAWGLPGHQLTATARALIALKVAAIPSLQSLLADRRSAPLEGSQDATTSAMYRNRVCDYAWIFLAEIKNQHYEYSQSPEVRDAAIEAMRKQLEAETN